MITPQTVTPAYLKKIFNAAEKSLFNQSPLSEKELNQNFESSKNIDINKIDWTKFYELIMYVTFYSGFRAETVNSKSIAIKKALGKLNVVAKFKEPDIRSALKNDSIIRHEAKIRACVYNAKAIIDLKTKYKTLQNYLSSFGDLTLSENINILAKDLKNKFKYLGGITVNHLLTDIGLNVVKPDRVLCRIFYRLGLIKSVTDYDNVIKVGQLMTKATGLPIRYIDLIFVFYGQVGYKKELDIDKGICLEKNPNCNICKLNTYCYYYKQTN